MSARCPWIMATVDTDSQFTSPINVKVHALHKHRCSKMDLLKLTSDEKALIFAL